MSSSRKVPGRAVSVNARGRRWLYSDVMATHIEVPYRSLSPDALTGLIDEFITREGTDYGEREHSLEEKRAQVRGQLARHEIAIVFEFASESTTIVTRDELAGIADRGFG